MWNETVPGSYQRTYAQSGRKDAKVGVKAERKLGPYRRMAASGRLLPLLMACETAKGRASDRGVYGVEQGRSSGGAELPIGKARSPIIPHQPASANGPASPP